MPTETEELRLVVNLTDNATAGLSRLRHELQELGGGRNKEAMERFKRDTEEVTKKTRNLKTELGEFGMVGNLLAGAIGGIAGGFAALAGKLALSVIGFGDAAKAMRALNIEARQIGVDPVAVENIVKQYERVGVSQEKTMQNLRGLSQAVGELFRPGSQGTRDLMNMAGSGLQSRAAMQESIEQLKNAKTLEEQNSIAIRMVQNVRANAYNQYKSQQEATLRANELARKLGVDLTIIELDKLKELSAEDRRRAQQRQQDLLQYNKTSNEIWSKWTDIKDILGEPILKTFASTLTDISNIMTGIVAAFKWIDDHVGDWGDMGKITTKLRRQLPTWLGGTTPEEEKALNEAEAARAAGRTPGTSVPQVAPRGAGTTPPAQPMYAPSPSIVPGGGGGYAGGGGYPSSGTGGAGGDGRGYGKPTPSGSDTGGMDASVPSDILARAKQVALQGGPVAVEQFMASQGYPKRGAWCGEFAASVVKSVGGTPPKDAAIASNWRNWGEKVEGAPQPGDIAVRKGPATGATGSHVTIVEGVDEKSGTFRGLGGNQGGAARVSRYGVSKFEFRRGSGALPEGQTAGAGTGKGAGDTPANSPIGAGAGGKVDPAALEGRLGELIRGSKLEGFVPKDAEKYGIKTGSAEEWANLMKQMAGKESSFNTGTVGDKGQFGGAGSRGLFQLSPQDAITYGLQDQPFTKEQLADPDFNARMAVKIAERRALAGGIGGQKGMAAYWAGQKGYLARGDIAVDRAQVDRAQAATTKVEGTGKLTVDVNAPRGTKVGAEGNGLFKKTEINRQTQMEPAARGPEPAMADI